MGRRSDRNKALDALLRASQNNEQRIALAQCGLLSEIHDQLERVADALEAANARTT